MKTENQMEYYLEKGANESILRKGAVQMAVAAEDGKYFDFLRQGGIEEKVENGMIFSYLYQKTGEQSYLDCVEKLKEKLQEETQGNEERSHYKLGSEVQLEEMYQVLPFFMECETRYGKKEQYNYIIGQFEKVQGMIYQEELGLLVSDLEQVGYYMMALVDVMDAMNIEIYEQYRKLQDYYKVLLKEMRKKQQKWNRKTELMMAYTMLKGCRMNILLKEKYQEPALKLLEAYERQISDDMEIKMAGIFMMAYAQKLLLQKEME